MQYVIKQVDAEDLTTFYNGSVFVPDLSEAKVIETITDARYLQGVFQSQFINSEVSKVSASVSVSLG
jgi:hypothetical protein